MGRRNPWAVAFAATAPNEVLTVQALAQTAWRVILAKSAAIESRGGLGHYHSTAPLGRRPSAEGFRDA